MARSVVIEDSSRVRGIAIELLGRLGIEAEGIATAKEGASFLIEYKPDLVLLDWDLPKLGALDILTAMAEAALSPKPKVILMATENDPKQFALARAAGAARYILKPFDADDLRAALRGAGVNVDQDTD
ncbi:response regulator [Parvularcula lutaonensis]|uniref:Response regulator n=1 Tax=Parvularcula lutaonensis TaxID=491923 RepID=A0ABV7MDB5_9PROT|nr:response regulator [Parvularcula lutaonensis]GGY40210.1 hypothetical protein GCM10007148_05850 [Parvularcula lutaonensis]